MIVVTGANGKLGRAVVEKLLDRLPPAEELAVSVRDPEKAGELEERGVRVRHGDFADAASLAGAFEGASRVLIVSAATTGDVAVGYHRTAIDAAKEAGAQRILYTSHVGADPDSPFPPMPDHAATEEALQDSGVPFTSLRNGFYAEFAATMLGDAPTTGELSAPEDGPVAWTSHPDLAEAAAIALTEDGHDGATLDLTGSEAIDLAGIAAIASELAGGPIRRVVVPDDEYRDGMVAKGVPEERVAVMMGFFEASRQGGFEKVDPTLARLIDRPPISLRSVLSESIAAQPAVHANS